MNELDRKLLDEVVANPLDDAPRLVLSDVLQERGDARGVFILMQCRLQDRGLGPGARANFARETAALLEEHGAQWAAAARGFRHTMRRGFIDEVEAPAAPLAARSTLFDDEPITRLTLLEAKADDIEPLAAIGAFARVARLTIRGNMGDEGARALARALAPRSAPLQVLNVAGTAIGPRGSAELVEALNGCRTLTLTNNPIGDDGLAALAKSKALSSLTTLFVSDAALSDEGVTALAKARSLGSLSRLGLARNEDVTAASLALVAASKKLKSLRWLEYSDDDGVQSIATRSR